MATRARSIERLVVKRPFEAWSIAVPSTFAEAFVEGGSYWHAYDAPRSVSLTSVLLTEDHGPVPTQSILAPLGDAAPPDLTPLADLPPAWKAGQSKATCPSRHGLRGRCPAWWPLMVEC